MAAVVVTLAAATLTPGGTTTATAVLKDVNGNTLTGRTITWTTSDAAKATVNSTGLVTAVAVGTATVTATSEGKSGTSAVIITPVPIATVTVAPSALSLVVGSTQQLSATTLDANGGTLTGRTITWTTSDAAKATVNSTGLVTAVAVGTATVTATSEGKSGTSAVTITPVPIATVTVAPSALSLVVGSTQQLSATTLDADGGTLTGRTITWTTSDAAKAAVNSTGLVTAVAVGTTTVTATSEGKSGTSAVIITPVPIATVTVAPSALSLVVGSTQQLSATTLDANGGTLTGRTITWTTADAAKATVNSTGLVTAVAVGTATVTATSEGKSGTSAVTITPVPIATVTVAPSALSLVVGSTQQLSATTLDANGGTLTGRTITWTTSDATKATVNSTGLVTAVAVGTATVTATSEGKSGTSAVTITFTAEFSQQGPKLVGTGAVGNAAQGWSVSISADGNTALVGGPEDNSRVGAVWVWTRRGGIWTQEGPKLVGSGVVPNAQIPYFPAMSVSLSADGNTAIVGSPYDNNFAGAVWVWTRSGGIWTQQGPKLVGSGAAGNAQQGYSVSLSADGNTAIVGGYNDNDFFGAAWVWTRSGGIWTQQGNKLVSSGAVGARPAQGSSVSVSAGGNTAIVGGITDNNGVGAAWVWTRSGGIWTQQGTKLVGSGAVGFAGQGQSVSLSADGNTAIVGGDYDNAEAGAAWVWTRSGGLWTQEGPKLVGAGAVGFPPAYQGTSVSLSADGNTAIVGGGYDGFVGAAWVWIRSGGLWTQLGTKLVGSGAVGISQQGRSVFLSADGNTAIVGGFNDNPGTGLGLAIAVGAAWVYTRAGGNAASAAAARRREQ